MCDLGSETCVLPEEPISPKKIDNKLLITREIVEASFKNDHGPEAVLSSYEIIDFTKPGDNYAALVTSILCQGEINKVRIKNSYVVKLNNQWQLTGSERMTAELFLREGKFFTEVKDCLNKILDELDEHNLYLPVSVYQSYELGKEMLIMKDLREKGFKMFDRHIGMDLKHATMVMNALARVHAAGFIYKERNKEVSLLSKFPYLFDDWLENDNGRAGMEKFFTGLFENGISSLENREGYKEPIDWLLRNKDRGMEIFIDMLTLGEESFQTVCHGDIWNNNILFSYDSQNEPEDIILLDLQLGRISSVATDLNYFFFASFDGEDRDENLDALLRSYYSTLESIVKKGHIKPPFTLDELRQEVEDKYIYGMIIALMIVPIITSTEITDYTEMNDDNMDEMLENDRKKNEEMMKNNRTFRSRYLAAFTDGIKRGVFKKI